MARGGGGRPRGPIPGRGMGTCRWTTHGIEGNRAWSLATGNAPTTKPPPFGFLADQSRMHYANLAHTLTKTLAHPPERPARYDA